MYVRNPTRCMVKVAARTLRLPSASGNDRNAAWLRCTLASMVWQIRKKYSTFHFMRSTTILLMTVFCQIFFCWNIRYSICLRWFCQRFHRWVFRDKWTHTIVFLLMDNCTIFRSKRCFNSFCFRVFLFFFFIFSLFFLSVVTRQNFHMNACAILHILH